MPKDDDLSWLHESADRLGLEENDRDGFIKEGMTRLGYKIKETVDWEEPEPQGGGNAKASPMFGRPAGGAPKGGSGERRASGQYRD